MVKDSLVGYGFLMLGLILLQHGGGTEALLIPTSHGPVPLLPTPTADHIAIWQAHGSLPAPVQEGQLSRNMQGLPEFQAYIVDEHILPGPPKVVAKLSKRPEYVDLPPEQSVIRSEIRQLLAKFVAAAAKQEQKKQQEKLHQQQQGGLQTSHDETLKAKPLDTDDMNLEEALQILANKETNENAQVGTDHITSILSAGQGQRRKRNPRCLRTCLHIEKLNPMQCHHLC
eukprot:TRINITY_DN19042_c0_g1_i1.p1 TRINITY_DN19042_c0_g1~~TRINITY_DN19042_c0_g1_i1.p1  ORF type:complete len:228 (+),score=50.73 TRINITY_DN19042_c0_g1_i1:96-779(+)